eukprot:GHVL01014759.1.p1 GENE.GHVL01014759.1~~GHVL01014759.1.p1  ORF type:complete len:394 (+),score=70.59 GHVL01014759.1:247-1428(+)
MSKDRISSIQNVRLEKELELLQPLKEEGYSFDVLTQNCDSKKRQNIFSKYPGSVRPYELSIEDVIFVTISQELLKNTLEPVVFVLISSQKFPFEAPKLYSISRLVFPSIADGRELLLDVIGALWTPALQLRQIFLKIPNFVDNLVELCKSTVIDPLGYFDGMVNMEWFEDHTFYETKCLKLCPGNNQTADRMIVMTEGAFLVIEPVGRSILGGGLFQNNDATSVVSNGAQQLFQKIQKLGGAPLGGRFGKIRCWFFLAQLNSITINLRRQQIMLHFQGHPGQGGRKIYLCMENVHDFTKQLRLRMQALGIPPADSKAKLNFIQSEIRRLRALLDDENAEVNFELVQQLSGLHQSQVELLSLEDNQQLEEQIDSLHDVLQHKRVIDLLETHKNN